MEEKYIKKFYELSLDDLYSILKLRTNIFVVEQECSYEELDRKDKESIHLYYKENGEIIAYLRIIPQGLSYKTVSFGRVCVKKEFRSKDLGRKIVNDALYYIENIMKENVVTIGAQEYLQRFYSSLGFIPISEVYDEDGIPHVDMQRGE